MNTKQRHGIKVGDLVKFKHHIFDGMQPVHLVTEILAPSTYSDTVNIRLYGNSGITHRAKNFIVISRGRQ